MGNCICRVRAAGRDLSLQPFLGTKVPLPLLLEREGAEVKVCWRLALIYHYLYSI